MHAIVHSDVIAPADLQVVWAHILEKLKENFGLAVYTSWFKKLTLVGTQPYTKNSVCIVLGAPTKFVRDWVITRYSERIEELWQAEDDRFYTVSFVVLNENEENAPVKEMGETSDLPRLHITPMVASAADPNLGEGVRDEADGKSAEDMDVMATALDPRFTFDSFVACSANELALAAAKRLIAGAPSAAFNPLFLYSKVGLGKTHLMQAIAWAKIQDSPACNVVYLSAEKFMYHFVHALRSRTMFAFKQQLRAADMFMVDDIQFISGKETTQDEFFQTFNALIDQNKQIVLSADKCPTDFGDMAERVRSRLNGGLVVDIGMYDASTRLAILRKKIDLGHMGEDARAIHADTLDFLAQRIVSNIRELEGALRRLVTYASVMNVVVTPQVAQEVLKDLLRIQEKRVGIEDIQACVSSYYGIDVVAMLSNRRDRTLAKARQVAMYLAKKLTNASLPEIGRKFGGRGHATVIHAVTRVEEMMGMDSSLCKDFEKIRPLL